MAKILVVDDERPIVEAISYNLRKEGYEVMTAADAQECVAVARRQPPDLVLLDIMLPSGSGLDVCRQLRLEHGNIPVLLLTAKVQNSDQRRFADLGVEAVLFKPFDPMTLSAQIASVLGWS